MAAAGWHNRCGGPTTSRSRSNAPKRRTSENARATGKRATGMGRVATLAAARRKPKSFEVNMASRAWVINGAVRGSVQGGVCDCGAPSSECS